MHAWVQTGKAGDIFAILPAIKIRSEQEGKRQDVVVSKQYAPVLGGIDYVNPVPVDIHWQDLHGAILWAKKRYDKITVPQIHGDPKFNFQRKKPSFVLDMWDRAGMVGSFDSRSLEIPFNRIAPSKTVFFADHSESSPFFFAREMESLINTALPEHQVVRASSIRLKNIKDFIPIMEASDLIVSVETSFLHLSSACSKPVIALVADKPDPWRGTPWQKRFAIHCRYKDFEHRRQEISAAMCRAVNKISIPEPVIFQTGRRNGYNMTSLRGVNIYRYHDADWKTKLAIDDGNGVAQDIRFPSECDEYSLEDARLFTHKGNLHISYTCARSIDGMFRSIQAYGPLEFSGSKWEVKSHIVPKIKGNDFSGMQKNYVPFEIGNKLHFVFGISGQRQIVHELIGDKVVTTYESDAPKWNWGEIRGGSIANYKDHLLRIFHSRIGRGHKNYEFRYYIGAALMEKEPPFRTVAVSSFPVLAGNERYVDCGHWKPNCCLPYGIETDGTSIKISGGINDCESFTMTLSGGDLHL